MPPNRNHWQTSTRRGFSRWFRISLSRPYVYHAILFILTKYRRDFLNWRGKRHVVALTGVLLALAGLFPVFGALIVSIPLPVLGGAGLMMFAMIIAAGIQMLDKVARSKRNGLIIAISIGCGLAVTTRPELLDKLPHFFKEVLGSGITVGSLLALILNLVLPEDKVEETKE